MVRAHNGAWHGCAEEEARAIEEMLEVLVELFSEIKLYVREENFVLDLISSNWIGFYKVSWTILYYYSMLVFIGEEEGVPSHGHYSGGVLAYLSRKIRWMVICAGRHV